MFTSSNVKEENGLRGQTKVHRCKNVAVGKELILIPIPSSSIGCQVQDQDQ